ncbi:hypothetical protein CCR75_008495 [Bremia lactucae]|uniref:Uncharacterized protein n=1 Tax=Bremia lactucae TaxID=4779 RepID=A0A976FM29_BRELC|nr:hypothetical protein CCR75_008495 [Bremia lactucae]
MRNSDDLNYHCMREFDTEGWHKKSVETKTIRLLKTQDLAYMHMKHAVDMRKAERLNCSLHFVGAPKINKHTLFVNERDFDVARHFDTAPELADRAFKRIRTRDLETTELRDFIF